MTKQEALLILCFLKTNLYLQPRFECAIKDSKGIGKIQIDPMDIASNIILNDGDLNLNFIQDFVSVFRNKFSTIQGYTLNDVTLTKEGKKKLNVMLEYTRNLM